MRGEDLKLRLRLDVAHGSPPHARGRQLARSVRAGSKRITPACAGKTVPVKFNVTGIQDHPRMRGEDCCGKGCDVKVCGSPPHARGRHAGDDGAVLEYGITPACAGKTPVVAQSGRSAQDHPRMRGEDVAEIVAGPRENRITPACAGKTPESHLPECDHEDHPRMRGEDEPNYSGIRCAAGSPPHARGRQLDSPGNPAKSLFSLPVFFCSQPSPLGWFLRWVLGLGSSLWKQR